MAYRLLITPEARRDLKTSANYIRRDSRQAAERWLKQMSASIHKLATNPQRCPLAPEADLLDRPIRELLCGTGNRGTYRVLFTIVDNLVYVFRVLHGSKLPLGSDSEIGD